MQSAARPIYQDLLEVVAHLNWAKQTAKGEVVVNDKTEQALISLLEELLEKGDFFYSAIESNDMMFDFEEWKERALTALEEAKTKR